MLGMRGEKYRIWGMGMGHTGYEKKQKVKWKEYFGGTVREGLGMWNRGRTIPDIAEECQGTCTGTEVILLEQ